MINYLKNLMIKNLFEIHNKEIFSIGLIIILALSRLIPHPPNVTPIIAISMMGGFFFKNIKISIFVLLIAMLISDFVIGFHYNMFLVYIPLLIINILFFKIIINSNYKNLILFCFFSSSIFFIVSNFGVWLFGNLYEKNIHGLITCYYMAIPFFKNTLLSTIGYSYLTFFLGYYFLDKNLEKNI